MSLEVGIQLHLPSFKDLTLKQLVDTGKAAEDAGFQQIWVTDNMECRNIFIVLASLAHATNLRLGTAIMAQYFRSPIEAATSLVPISELMDGRELNVALGTGNPFTGRYISMPRRVGFMRETAVALKALVNGKPIQIDDFPLLREYFQFTPGATLAAEMESEGDIKIYCGSNGPMGLKLAGELTDGLLFGWTTMPNQKMGLLDEKLDIVDGAAKKAGTFDTFKKVTELKVSVAKSHEEARRFARVDPSCGRHILSFRHRGYSEEDLQKIGITPKDMERLEEAYKKDGPYADFSEILTDEMIDSSYIAGDPKFCIEKMQELGKSLQARGFTQLIFSELGPDQAEAAQLIKSEIIPALAGDF